MESAVPITPPPTDPDADAPLAVVFLFSPHMLWWVATVLVACLMSAFVVRTYVRVHDPVYGWTKMILFGQDFADRTTPRLQRLTHYTETSEGGHGGYDGQFYAQLALDVSLRDPAFRSSLDMPAYRARRIGLPAASFVLGGFKPRRILQAYALGNLLFWFVLLAALWRILRPRSLRALLCLCGGCLCSGAIASMERSLVDLPATALLVAGLAVGSLGGCALLAAAALTRETSVLAAAGLWDGRPPWREGRRGWGRFLLVVAAAVVPLGLWLLYVNYRLGHDTQAGVGNFDLPLLAMGERLVIQIHRLAAIGGYELFKNIVGGDWLYTHYATFEMTTILATFFQGLFLVLRRDWRSAFWRVGACYVLLGILLGPAVWDDTSAAARVLLPMTVCFYLQLARARGWWFWTFLVLGSLSLPFAVHDFWAGL